MSAHTLATRRAAVGCHVLRFATCIALVLGCFACGGRKQELVRALTNGEPARGSRSLAERGCGSCHEIPGVARARGHVGPPLDGLASRSYLAGRLPNEPLNLIRWIRHPREVDPQTAMPELGVSDAEARDMAAYLYTLR